MTCHDGYLSLNPEVLCRGCDACVPVDCPRCGDLAYFSAGANQGCIQCGYLEGRDDCAGCGCVIVGEPVVVSDTERYNPACDAGKLYAAGFAFDGAGATWVRDRLRVCSDGQDWEAIRHRESDGWPVVVAVGSLDEVLAAVSAGRSA